MTLCRGNLKKYANRNPGKAGNFFLKKLNAAPDREYLLCYQVPGY
jgi:hypothetical protein